MTAVQGLDLTINQGEVYGFLGRNGAGKTTTMRVLLGLIRPTAGTAVVMGHPPGDPDGLAQLGALVEAPAFYPYLSGRDNLKLLARYAGVATTTIDEALEEVGLAERSGEKVKGHSMGMRQRLGVAATLLKRPSLLILDEPTNGLDPQGMASMRTFIRALGQGDRTVMLSSHLLGEVNRSVTVSVSSRAVDWSPKARSTNSVARRAFVSVRRRRNWPPRSSVMSSAGTTFRCVTTCWT